MAGDADDAGSRSHPTLREIMQAKKEYGDRAGEVLAERYGDGSAQGGGQEPSGALTLALEDAEGREDAELLKNLGELGYAVGPASFDEARSFVTEEAAYLWSLGVRRIGLSGDEGALGAFVLEDEGKTYRFEPIVGGAASASPAVRRSTGPVVVKRRSGVYIVGPDQAAVLAVEEAAAAVGVAGIIEKQKQLIKPPELVDELAAFAGRLRDALDHASGEFVSLDVSERERQVATFLIGQTRARRDLSWRVRHVCVDCGHASLSNPAYEKIKDRNRKIGALSRLGGLAVSPRGVTPFFMISSLMAFVKLDPKYVCRNCNGMAAEESIAVFCPSCKALHTEAVLDRCRCGHAFRDPAEVGELWVEKSEVLPAAALPLAEVELSGNVQAFAPAAEAGVVVLCLDDRMVEAWSLPGDEEPEAKEPTRLWSKKLDRGLVCAASADGAVVATAPSGGFSRDTFHVQVLEGHTGAVKAKVSHKGEGYLSGLAVSADGGQLAVATNVVDLFALPEGDWQASIKMGRGWMSAPDHLAFDADGSRIASDGTGHLWVWRVKDGAVVAKLPKGTDPQALVWSPRGGVVVLAGANSVTVQEVESQRLRCEIELEGKATAVAMSAEGESVAVGGQDGSVRVFRVADGAEQHRFSAGVVAVAGLAFDGGEQLAVASGRRLQIWAL